MITRSKIDYSKPPYCFKWDGEKYVIYFRSDSERGRVYVDLSNKCGYIFEPGSGTRKLPKDSIDGEVYEQALDDWGNHYGGI